MTKPKQDAAPSINIESLIEDSQVLTRILSRNLESIRTLLSTKPVVFPTVEEVITAAENGLKPTAVQIEAQEVLKTINPIRLEKAAEEIGATAAKFATSGVVDESFPITGDGQPPPANVETAIAEVVKRKGRGRGRRAVSLEPEKSANADIPEKSPNADIPEKSPNADIPANADLVGGTTVTLTGDEKLTVKTIRELQKQLTDPKVILPCNAAVFIVEPAVVAEPKQLLLPIPPITAVPIQEAADQLVTDVVTKDNQDIAKAIQRPALSPEQFAEFREKLFQYVALFRIEGGQVALPGVGGGYAQLSKFVCKRFPGVSTLAELSIEQWQDFITFMDHIITQLTVSGAVDYITQEIKA
jgi:hypothetical protein